MWCLWRLSTVRILPRTTVHMKKVTFLGTLAIQMLFQGKETCRTSKSIINIFFKTRNLPRQGPLDPPLRSKPWIHDPTHQNRVSGNLGELLLGIDPKMPGSIAHPKPPTTRLHRSLRAYYIMISAQTLLSLITTTPLCLDWMRQED